MPFVQNLSKHLRARRGRLRRGPEPWQAFVEFLMGQVDAVQITLITDIDEQRDHSDPVFPDDLRREIARTVRDDSNGHICLNPYGDK
jgi:hypothetical protein